MAQLGEMRPAAEVMDAAVVVLDTSPEAMDRVGTSTLMRLAQQSRDLPTALKAALALLDRTRGRVMPPVQPPASQELPKPEEEWPEWFTSRRLAYQEEQSSKTDELPR